MISFKTSDRFFFFGESVQAQVGAERGRRKAKITTWTLTQLPRKVLRGLEVAGYPSR